MTRPRFHSHPAGHVLNAAASGHRPRPGDLDELGLSAAQARALAAVAHQAADAYEAGDRGDARQLVREAFAELADDLGEPPAPPDPTDAMTPDQLAAYIARPY